jgi:phospholipid/cholesterol/gamma-HCH transport system ATP-binding protein
MSNETGNSESIRPPLIRLDQVAMRFGDQSVLRGISLDVALGETLVVIGESGCGKTVLLKLIIGLLAPSAGRITFDGRVLAELSDRDLTRERRRFGFLFQGAALFDSLTIFENVAFGLREGVGERSRVSAPSSEQGRVSAPSGEPSRDHIGEPSRVSDRVRKLDEAAIRDIVRQRLQEVGLPDGVEQQKPAQLSGGMKKRVGLARALALEPEVMLYDEPTTGLDPIMSDAINDLILQTRRRHPVTSIVVTHDMTTVHKVADRVVMLYPLTRLQPEEKQIIFDGPPKGLTDSRDPRVRQFVEGRSQKAENGPAR